MLIAIIFILGLCIGSFLNVLVDRLPNGESVIKGRSYCDHCKKTLRWYEMFPVISYLVLKGRCSRCKKKLSLLYPFGELTTGILFLCIAITLGINDQMLFTITGLVHSMYLLFIASCLIVIFFTDIKYGIIPDVIVFPASIVVFCYTALLYPDQLITHLVCAFGAFLFFLLLFLGTKGKGMGLGDVKFVFLMGLFLGFPQILIALYIAFLTGAAVAVGLVLLKRKRFVSGTIPFGPFLVIGTGISYFFSDKIIQFVIQTHTIFFLLQ